MPFKRVWDSSCPRIWSSWEDQGVKWEIQDLPPEDEKEALEIYVEHFLADEVMCYSTDTHVEPDSIRGICTYWKETFAQRTSLACYRIKDGKRELVALNACPVSCVDDVKSKEELEGRGWTQVYEALVYFNTKISVFKELGVDKYLGGSGLVVKRDARGARLGAKLLEAREPMCRALGIPATATVFTWAASQKLAERVGFKTILAVSFAELRKSGLEYPDDENVVLKLMVKKYE